MYPPLRRSTLALIVSLLITFPVLAQVKGPIREENVRAQLMFLASDAMQGRGSGTTYERIAAEYIGSQFRQFGLEPGGDTDASGTKSFVQRVGLQSSKFTAAPTLTVTSGSNVQKWEYGRDFLVQFLRASRISGDLQIVEPTGAFTKGTVVAVKLPDGANQDQRRDVAMRAFSAGAAGVVMLESDVNTRTREAGDARLPNLQPQRSGANEPFGIINLRKEALDTLLAMPSGTKVEFAGPTESTDASATWNAIGVLRGSDPRAANEAIILSAHLDHLGVNESIGGPDKIFNGADDDASGCVAVMELARVLAAGKRPRRTIYFVGFGSEERGGYGSQQFISNPPIPLTQIVANLNLEMSGRPDPKTPAGMLWLTGFERSNLGPELVKQGAPLVADPHPEQNFFQRSDNYNLALRGVVAQTVSSFGLHTDYHRPSDEVSKIDFAFMTHALNSLVKPVQWLANSNFRPAWVPGKEPKR